MLLDKEVYMSQDRFNPVSREDERIEQEILTGERALYRGRRLDVRDCVFKDGESPLKEAQDINLSGCEFQYKYPLWYAKDINVRDCVWQELGRSGVWYTDNIRIEDSMIWAPKNFRRCSGVYISRTSFADAEETFWSCDGIELHDVTARGNYFGMNSKNIVAENLNLYGNYAFDGCENVTVRHAKLLTKDAFWNCRNVIVEDSYISGEYLGWNTSNITFVNCMIESNQGLDYIDGLKMVNCRMVNTGLAFEYSTDMDVEIDSAIDSILNPGSGVIRSRGIGECIIEPDNCDISKTQLL